MKWQKLKGVDPETWFLRGLRIRRTKAGYLLWQAQSPLDGIGPKMRDQTFLKLSEAKRFGKEKLAGM